MRSGAGVGTVKYLSEALFADVRIALRRSQIGMPEQFLHNSKIGATVEKMRGKRVT